MIACCPCQNAFAIAAIYEYSDEHFKSAGVGGIIEGPLKPLGTTLQ